MQKRNDRLTQNFLQRLDTTPIQTGKYLWHVNYSCRSRDLKIATSGLLCPENYAVFAHNDIQKMDDMYPMFLDYMDYDLDFYEFGMQYTYYSFWRINTAVAGVEWYIDPNMERDLHCGVLGGCRENFVCTTGNVRPEALELFEFDMDLYSRKTPKILYTDGVASISPFRNEFDALIRVTKSDLHYRLTA